MGISYQDASPAKGNIFDIDDTSVTLDKERREIFHHCVAKLLYVDKRWRLNIQLAVIFLCTRVTESTEQGWEKMR